MDAARIADLLQPFLGNQPLPPDALKQTSMYIDLLLRWNARINLTAVRDPESIVTRHFGESFFLARHLFPKHNPDVEGVAQAQTLSGRDPLHDVAAPGENIEDMSNRAPAPAHSGQIASAIDIGSGAGFPGLPLKIWAKDIALTLIESNHKKATFLREVARALTLIDVNVMNDRAETLAAQNLLAGTVTLRAVERFDDVLPIAARFVAPLGRLALLIGSAQVSVASSLLHSFTWSDPFPIPHSHSRVLILGTTAST